MRTIISMLILTCSLLLSLANGNQAQAVNANDLTNFVADNHKIAPEPMTQEEGGAQVVPEQTNVENGSSGNFLLDNWGALLLGLLGFVDLIARLTPSEKDNSIVNFLVSLFNTIIPNMKKGGGSFKLLSK